MTNDDSGTIQEEVMNIIQLIATSRIIPEGHKLKYLEYIQKNGFSERMIEELMKVFAKEEASLDKEIQEDDKLVADLDQIIAEEEAKTDEQQARILASLEDYHERNEHNLNEQYEELDTLFGKAEEEMKEQSEHAQEDAIRAKLGLK